MEKMTLDNGLRVLLLPIEGARSASVGVWLAAGSRFEDRQTQGISHFVEHMLFKGTASRSARQISEEMDRLGGGLNAYTTKEYTRYYAQTLAENAVPAMQLLTDMLLHARMDPESVEIERGVILEEIAMYDDVGEDLAHEALCAAVWPDSPLGRPICGTRDSVAAITSADLLAYVHDQYTPERMVAVAAGGYDRAAVLAELQATLGALPGGRIQPQADSPAFTSGLAVLPRDFEQVSLELAFPGLAARDERRYAMMLFNFLVGGGASSRLFQRLREELGLAYSIYSAHYANEGSGLFTVAAGVSRDQQFRVLDEVRQVLAVIPGSVTEEEFGRAKAQVKASFILGLETVAAQASYIGRNELLEGRELTSAEVLAQIDRLTIPDIDRLAADILRAGPLALAVAGPVGERDKYEQYILPL